jgi:hypothetical protein
MSALSRTVPPLLIAGDRAPDNHVRDPRLRGAQRHAQAVGICGQEIVMLLRISALLAAAGLIYLLPKTLSAAPGLDFKLIWLAGKLWAAGENPYGPGFATAYLAEFGPGPVSAFWVYPPYWLPIAVPLSWLPVKVAGVLWNLASLALVVAAAHLVARALSDGQRTRYLTIFCAGLAFACFMQATAVTISIGQTSALLYFGLAALLCGFTTGNRWLLLAALVALALKPNVGLVAFAAVAATSERRVVLWAAGVCLLLMLPLALHGDAFAELRGFAGNLSAYSDPKFAANAPPNLVGLAHLLPSAGNARPWLTALTVLTAVVAAILFATGSVRRVFPLFVAVTLIGVPLHSYDLIPLAIVAAFAVHKGILTPPWLMISVGLLVSLRAGNLAQVTGLARPDSLIFPESTMATIGLALVLIGALYAWLSEREAVALA